MAEYIIIGVILFVIIGSWSPKSMRAVGRAVREAFTREAAPPRPVADSDLEVCYRILGVSSSASWDEIQQAYRRKAKVHHPDRGGDEDAMRALNEAFSLLKQTRGARR